MHPHQDQPALRTPSPATTSTAFTPAGAVTATTTVEMVQMRSTVPLVFQPPVGLPTSPVITTSASPRIGCVTVRMTAVMALTNRTAVSLFLSL